MSARSPRAATTGPDAGDRPSYTTHADLMLGFDEFYKSTRDRLLLQTFALTGDLAVARSAVREAFVVSWHHWRKVSRRDDPEMAVRPTAWRKALRRSSTRPWHRAKGWGEHQPTVEALGRLPLVQRKALLLTQLAAVTMNEMAHEIGLPLDAAERELQLGAAQLAMSLDIPTSGIPLALSGLSDITRGAVWPRVTIIRRAGSARRRAHTVIGSTAAVVALVAGGIATTDVGGARPTLARSDTPVAAAPAGPGTALGALPDTSLLSLDTVSRALTGRTWELTGTSDNSAGDGKVLPCQTSRYADRRGTAAWVRTFSTGTTAGPGKALTQFAEASTDEERAERTYRRSLRWFTSCPPPEANDAISSRLQLLRTSSLEGVGERSAVLVLRSRGERLTHVVGVARSGLFTTVTSLQTPSPARGIRRQGVADLLTTAVTQLCELPGGGACPAAEPRLVDRSAYPIRPTTWMLDEIDLPPLNGNPGTWVGTPVADLDEDRVDSGAVGCETAHLFGSFNGKPVRGNQFRTFVVSGAKLPAAVGLTQTVATLPTRRAAAYVERIRTQMAACPDLDASAGTEVTELAAEDAGKRALSVWHLTTALPGGRSIEYDVAVVRSRTAVSLLVYVSAPRAQIEDGEFVYLARRAQDRLQRMEPYSAG